MNGLHQFILKFRKVFIKERSFCGKDVLDICDTY